MEKAQSEFPTKEEIEIALYNLSGKGTFKEQEENRITSIALLILLAKAYLTELVQPEDVKSLSGKKINIIKNLARLLEMCKGAISDAIYCEDGLDGGIGDDLIREIDEIKDLDKLTTCQECDYLIQENLKLDNDLTRYRKALEEIKELARERGIINHIVYNIATRALQKEGEGNG